LVGGVPYGETTTYGALAGYVGGLDRKRALLEIEHAGSLRAGRVREGLLW
jgi:O6-methylguanine-DNA--protein-cysteine methyltransferase